MNFLKSFLRTLKNYMSRIFQRSPATTPAPVEYATLEKLDATIQSVMNEVSEDAVDPSEDLPPWPVEPRRYQGVEIEVLSPTAKSASEIDAAQMAFHQENVVKRTSMPRGHGLSTSQLRMPDGLVETTRPDIDEDDWQDILADFHRSGALPRYTDCYDPQ